MQQFSCTFQHWYENRLTFTIHHYFTDPLEDLFVLKAFTFALTALLSMASNVAQADETNGNPADIYHDFCSVCHGDSGQGAVWAQGGLDPLPVDFTDPQEWLKLKNRDRMIENVTFGVPQTAMAGWGNRLSTVDIALVVDYVRDTFMQLDLIPDYSEIVPVSVADAANSAVDSHEHDAHGASDLNAPFEIGLRGDLSSGEKLYNANCVECHGLLGDGKGPRAYFVFPKPRNFNDPNPRATYSRSHLFNATAKGVLGTEMPAWDKVLTNQQLVDISEYVFETFIAARNPLAEVAPTAHHNDASSMGHDDVATTTDAAHN